MGRDPTAGAGVLHEQKGRINNQLIRTIKEGANRPALVFKTYLNNLIMTITEQEKDIITRALKAHSVQIAVLLFKMRNQEARKQFDEEQRAIYDLIEKLKKC